MKPSNLILIIFHHLKRTRPRILTIDQGLHLPRKSSHNEPYLPQICASHQLENLHHFNTLTTLPMIKPQRQTSGYVLHVNNHHVSNCNRNSFFVRYLKLIGFFN